MGTYGQPKYFSCNPLIEGESRVHINLYGYIPPTLEKDGLGEVKLGQVRLGQVRSD